LRSEGVVPSGATHRIIAGLTDGPISQLSFCCIFALLTRLAVFGDPVFHIDESWYLLVGQRLSDGARLYVDVWDRKPPGLFFIYAIAAKFSNSIIAYQIMAWLSASLTAFLVARMAARISGPKPALIAAAIYLATLAQLGGAGGQSPVSTICLSPGPHG
jgi:4-amino-4-deoxy-L-arabinose transferase-like glycosyltransferase